jgi:Tol biopolymer transport system component
MQTGTTTLVSVNTSGQGSGNGASFSPVISSDGRFVLFRSLAQNLASGSFGAGVSNLFLRDRQLGTTRALTAATTGTGVSAAAMTPNGYYVAFIGIPAGSSSAALYIWNSLAATRTYMNPVAYPVRVAISSNGKRLAYSTSTSLYSPSTSLIVADLMNSNNDATVGSGSSGSFTTDWGWNFSADGSWLVFETTASLTAIDTNKIKDVYLYNIIAKTNFLVSHDVTGTMAGDGASDSPAISPDGTFIAYRSYADNLAPGETNGLPNVYLYDRTTGLTALVSASQFGPQSGDNRSLSPFFSGDGQTLVFQSAASDLVTNDVNRTGDVFSFNLFAAGLIPTFPVQIIPAASAGQPPTLQWPVVPGKAYQVLFKANLSDPAWQNLSTNVTIVGATAYFTDTTAATGQRFYQIIGF